MTDTTLPAEAIDKEPKLLVDDNSIRIALEIVMNPKAYENIIDFGNAFTIAKNIRDKYEPELQRLRSSLEGVEKEREEMREALNHAQCELTAMYKRVGIKGSNVLDEINSFLK